MGGTIPPNLHHQKPPQIPSRLLRQTPPPLFFNSIFHFFLSTINRQESSALPHNPLPPHRLLPSNPNLSSDFDPLLKGHTPVYHITTLQSAAVLFLLLILSIVLLLSEITSLLPFPPDLFFGVASGIFFLQYSVSSSSSSLQISKLQVKCDSVSARIFHSLPGPRLPSAALCGGRWPWGLNVTAGITGIADWTLPVLNVNRFLKKPDGDDEFLFPKSL